MSAPLVLSRDAVRSIDRRAIDEFGIPGVVLMENAGRGAAELLRSLGVSGRVVICCGKGNNGGDGFVMARHLDNAGVAVHVLLFARPEELTGAAAINYEVVARSKLSLRVDVGPELDAGTLRAELAGADWVVDALFGTGLRGPLGPPFDQVVAAINASAAKVFAVDIPSGLHCDSGLPLGPTVAALHVATFVGWKRGFTAESARTWLGQVHVVDIGAPRALLESFRT